MFEDRMKTPAIPERVYTLCTTVKNKGIQEAELKELLEPAGIGEGKTSYFGDVRDAAMQLGLIKIIEGKIVLAVDKKHVASMDAMRQYFISNISMISDSLFCTVSKEYFLLDEKIYSYSSVSDPNLVSYFSQKLGVNVFESDMRAWRFWATFLGLGNLHGMLLLPNAQQYLKTILGLGILKEEEYSFSEFIAAIRPYCGFILEDEAQDKSLNMAFSNGLRALHDQGIIQLSHKLDSGEMWFLYESELHAVKSTVTHVIVRG